MSESERNISDKRLEALLGEAREDRFAPFFDQRVIEVIRQEEEATVGFSTVRFAENLLMGFRRLAYPVTAACLMMAVYNVHTATESTLGVSANLLEAIFSIPAESLDAAFTL